jgi:hypothetical protein
VGSYWRAVYKIILLILWSRGTNILNTNIGLEFAGSQEERKTEANLEKDSFGGRRKIQQNMERS